MTELLLVLAVVLTCLCGFLYPYYGRSGRRTSSLAPSIERSYRRTTPADVALETQMEINRLVFEASFHMARLASSPDIRLIERDWRTAGPSRHQRLRPHE